MGIRERIEGIGRARRGIIGYSQEIDKLSKPLVTDIRHVNWIYEFIADNCKESRGGCELRRVYLFVILSLYSPSSLIGMRMRHGLRNTISKTLGCSITVVSHSISNILFTYDHYKRFKSNADNMLNLIIEELISREIVTRDEALKYVK